MNKKFYGLMMGAALIATLTACGGQAQEPNTQDDISAVESGPKITDMNEGTVTETHKLATVDRSENEPTESLYHKKGKDEQGETCYVLKDAESGQPLYLPLHGTVVYTMDEGEPYAEKILIQYKADGESVEESQWRIYVSANNEKTE